MKPQKVVLCCLLLLVSGTVLNAQSKRELRKQKKLAEYALTKKFVQNGQFVFMTQYVVTQTGDRTEAIGEGLLIEGDQTYADFPFIGNSNRGEIGGAKGIKFTTSGTVFDAEYNDKKRKIFIKFEAEGDNENYSVFLTILGNRRTTVQISSSARGIMSYEGKIQEVVINDSK
ncbi:DUF4251 domain-containing protein [Aureibaculum conchae]|uniref:DUF4251 domain-containing protein n=1 Tax=Aureibaculum sp. 2308TA14-22 TaxID=3108392 RepID=UPI003399ECD8